MATTMTTTDVTMPQLGESVTEGTVGAWLKEPGDHVDKYDPLVEIESDKASSELPSPLTGTLAEILVEPGTTVPVGTALCRIDEGEHPRSAAPVAAQTSETSRSATPVATQTSETSRSATPVATQTSETPRSAAPVATQTSETPRSAAPVADQASETPRSTAPVATQTSETPRSAAPVAATQPANAAIRDEADLLHTRSSPFVRRVAEEHGIDITTIDGSGAGGRVTKKDVLAAIGDHDSAQAEPSRSATPVAAARAAESTTTPPTNGRHDPHPVNPRDEAVPLTTMRRAIAEAMVTSASTAPHATVVMEVDMTAAVAWRATNKAAFREREGIDLTYLPIVLKSVTRALRDHPRLNATWDETRIIHRGEINLGVAVALDDGLVVPVIRNADRLSVSGLAHAVADLATKAREDALTPDDMAGGTFTVNNPGTFGSLVSTPILVPGQVGILSTEAIVKRPVVVDDMIAIRSMMNLSLTIDHRALDGLAATRFLAQLRDWLESVDGARLS